MNFILNKLFKFIEEADDKLDFVLSKSKTFVQYFFYFYAFYAAKVIAELENVVDRSSINFDPNWILFWANNLSFFDSVRIVQFIALISGILALLFYQKKIARIIIFLSFAQIHSILNSFSSPNHELYTLLFALFFLMFLPDIWKKENNEEKKKFLLYIWGAQAFVLLTYTMVGVNKIVSSIQQWNVGEIGFLSYKGLSTMITYKLAEFDSYAPLSDLIINNHWIGWTAAVISVYILTFSIVAAFRPNLHRLWGLLLISYHMGTFLTLGLWFMVFLAVDIFLFLNSPFYGPDTSWKEVASDLPIFGFVIKRLVGKKT